MRQMLAAVAAACAVVAATTGRAAAQIGNSQAAIPGGQVVSTSYPLKAGGAMIPRAVSPAGTPIGSPLMNPMSGNVINPYKQPGFDPSLIVAPASGFPGSPSPDLIDKLYDKLDSVTSFFRPAPSPRPTYTPGISRRNKERAMERNFHRD